MRRSIAIRCSLCVLVAAPALASIGCAAQRYRMDPSPNTSNLSDSSNEIDNRMALTMDTNLRALSNDFGRFWMMDHPSSLTLIPAMPFSWH